MPLHMEEVFKTSGLPTHTFVKPEEFDRTIVSLRTPGRGLIVEGPSGIGKTTTILKALDELGMREKVLMLSARKEGDRDLVKELPSMKGIGTVIIDDFHRLEDDARHSIADFLKTLADEERTDSKVIVVGINKAGDSLIRFAADLNDRVDTIRFETNSKEKVHELISKGEFALNIRLNTREKIVDDATGSFHIVQTLCRETCLVAGILESTVDNREVTVSLELVRERVLEQFARAFRQKAVRFPTGPKLRKDGRAPYLHLLYWLARSNDWSLEISQALVLNPKQRDSVNQITGKGFLQQFLNGNPDLQDLIHFDGSTGILSIEDPKFLYYLRNISWVKFARAVGYSTMEFQSRYDFALSFAGSERAIAEAIHMRLSEEEISVFYDSNEQHRILAENVEDYLGPIYRSEAMYVVCLLSKEFPTRIWTKFESDNFKERFGEGSVIPVWFSDAPPGIFDETRRIGGYTLNTDAALDPQVAEIVNLLVRKLAESRMGSGQATLSLESAEQAPIG